VGQGLGEDLLGTILFSGEALVMGASLGHFSFTRSIHFRFGIVVIPI